MPLESGSRKHLDIGLQVYDFFFEVEFIRIIPPAAFNGLINI